MIQSVYFRASGRTVVCSSCSVRRIRGRRRCKMPRGVSCRPDPPEEGMCLAAPGPHEQDCAPRLRNERAGMAAGTTAGSHCLRGLLHGRRKSGKLIRHRRHPLARHPFAAIRQPPPGGRSRSAARDPEKGEACDGLHFPNHAQPSTTRPDLDPYHNSIPHPRL
jgi:hypothetical protein